MHPQSLEFLILQSVTERTREYIIRQIGRINKLNNDYEPDALQCSQITQDKKRCTRIGTHSVGNAVRCETHHKLYLRDKNAQPIKKTVPR